ncbi:hypothetical protein HON52_02960 [Candidatus Uhrbacteria bacterium]|jgi:hypothetical protein|nr:hypothetical protein [Candidatus Uhrbacteria bacterium]
MKEVTSFIVRLYFAVISAVTFFTLMFSSVGLIETGLKTWVFPSADVPSWLETCSDAGIKSERIYMTDSEVTDEELVIQCEARNEQSWESHGRDKASRAVDNLALLIVSVPLFLLHFRFLYRDWQRLQGHKPKAKHKKEDNHKKH